MTYQTTAVIRVVIRSANAAIDDMAIDNITAVKASDQRTDIAGSGNAATDDIVVGKLTTNIITVADAIKASDQRTDIAGFRLCLPLPSGPL